MALKKDIVCVNGATGNYIKITAVYFNGVTKKADVEASTYLNEQAKKDGKIPLQSERITSVPCVTPDVAALYTHMHTLEKWSGAVDV